MAPRWRRQSWCPQALAGCSTAYILRHCRYPIASAPPVKRTRKPPAAQDRQREHDSQCRGQAAVMTGGKRLCPLPASGVPRGSPEVPNQSDSRRRRWSAHIPGWRRLVRLDCKGLFASNETPRIDPGQDLMSAFGGRQKMPDLMIVKRLQSPRYPEKVWGQRDIGCGPGMRGMHAVLFRAFDRQAGHPETGRCFVPTLRPGLPDP